MRDRCDQIIFLRFGQLSHQPETHGFRIQAFGDKRTKQLIPNNQQHAHIAIQIRNIDRVMHTMM